MTDAELAISETIQDEPTTVVIEGREEKVWFGPVEVIRGDDGEDAYAREMFAIMPNPPTVVGADDGVWVADTTTHHGGNAYSATMQRE